MMKVIVVKQIRRYQTGETRYMEIECETIDQAAKIRYPYKITNPTQGPPYEVVDKCPISIRYVPKITHPVDDLPQGAN